MESRVREPVWQRARNLRQAVSAGGSANWVLLLVGGAAGWLVLAVAWTSLEPPGRALLGCTSDLLPFVGALEWLAAATSRGPA